jgi:nitrite reductase (cytochrome c-552)
VSDHWVRSPLLNLNNACQTCHPWGADELAARVHTIQDRTYQLRNLALEATLALADAIETTAQADADHPHLTTARRHHRRAQFFTDFVEAENSMGFHADQEAARVLGLALNEARLGHVALLGGQIATAERRAPG